MAYLNTTIGGVTSSEFNIAGINRLAIIEKSKLDGVTGGGAAGTDVTALTLEAAAKFQEIFFAEDSANYSQELALSGSSKYINQTLNFRVDTDENDKAHSIILGRNYVALVKKNNGSWIILGQTNGLRCSAATANSTEEDANYSFTLAAKNLGFASNVTMTDVALDALINSTVA